MTFIVATNVIASQPPERQPTGRLHAHAKKKIIENNVVFSGYLHRCQSAPQTLTDWNTARSCQKENKRK